MAIELIGAGLPRTGTLTQKVALEQLGLTPCYHWVDVLADLRRVEQWEAAMDGRPRWDETFGQARATVDWPGGYFYRELAEAYPEAKVLLSVRDPESWERSFRETIWEMSYGKGVMALLAHARAEVDPLFRGYLDFVERMFWGPQGSFKDGYDEPAQLIEQMVRHTEEVKRAIPAERLLVWEVTEGWEPLCSFLGVEQPAGALPHANDRGTFLDRVMGGALETLQRWYAAKPAE